MSAEHLVRLFGANVDDGSLPASGDLFAHNDMVNFRRIGNELSCLTLADFPRRMLRRSTIR